MLPMTEPMPEYAATRAEQALPIGTTLSGDQFTITEQLGAGGFGITYCATDNVLGRTIVIKECFPEEFCFRNGKNVSVRSEKQADTFRSIVRMFMSEARALAKLRHPHIVGVHRAFEENGTAYMALDLIDGIDLFDILDTNPSILSPRRVTQILLQLLDAIETVHEVNLLHRDISPDNIIIEDTGAPVLIDFGAARADASRQTRAISSLLVVKDGYSPHEFYVAGSDQTPSSDLYSLAATFYHLLSGEAPPDSQTRMIAIAGHKPDPCVPLVGRISGYDDTFLAAIDSAMQIHPSDRLQSAAKWRSMISEVVSDDRPTSELELPIPGKEISLELELELSRLVAETNQEVSKSRLIAAEPVAAPAPVEKKVRPAWIEEFNKESLTPVPESPPEPAEVEETEAEGDPDAPETSAVALDLVTTAEPKKTETNWIGRAVEKQERLLREQELALELEESRKDRKRSSKRRSSLKTGEADEADTPEIVQTNRVRSLGISVGLLVCCYYAFAFYVL